jgi:hypothetical protein
MSIVDRNGVEAEKRNRLGRYEALAVLCGFDLLKE